MTTSEQCTCPMDLAMTTRCGYCHEENVEDLKNYLTTLRADLEVEVDLHGSRTEMAATLRRLIIGAEKELEKAKS